jgi:hypothetical protein
MPNSLKPVAIERYHLHDTRKRYPNCIVGRFYFNGLMDLDVAREAFYQTVQNHLFLQFSYDRKADQWITRNDYEDCFHISDSWPPKPKSFDVEQEIPNRFSFYVADKSGKSFLQTQTHHALVDGLSGLLFVSEMLVRYARIQTGETIGKIPEIDEKSLQRRGNLNLLSRRMLPKLPLQGIALFGAAKFLFRKVQPINRTEAPVSNGQIQVDYPRLLSHTIDASTARGLKDRARQLNVSLFELMMAFWFRAKIRWRIEQGIHAEGDWMRTIVPMSIRTRDDAMLPACNRVSMIQLDRKLRHIENFRDLVGGIKKELGIIRSWDLDRTFLVAIGLFNWVPGLMKRMMQNDVCRATSVFSSLGNPFKPSRLPMESGKIKAGNLVLDHFDLSVPIRKGTAVSIGASRYANQIQLTMHYDSDVLSEAQAARLWQEFICQLDDDQI